MKKEKKEGRKYRMKKIRKKRTRKPERKIKNVKEPHALIPLIELLINVAREKLFGKSNNPTLWECLMMYSESQSRKIPQYTNIAFEMNALKTILFIDVDSEII